MLLQTKRVPLLRSKLAFFSIITPSLLHGSPLSTHWSEQSLGYYSGLPSLEWIEKMKEGHLVSILCLRGRNLWEIHLLVLKFKCAYAKFYLSDPFQSKPILCMISSLKKLQLTWSCTFLSPDCTWLLGTCPSFLSLDTHWQLGLHQRFAFLSGRPFVEHRLACASHSSIFPWESWLLTCRHYKINWLVWRLLNSLSPLFFGFRVIYVALELFSKKSWEQSST